MGRVLGDLEAAFYESGGVLSPKTCTDAARAPVRRPVLDRSDRHLAVTGRFTEAVSLGVPECVELGGYYAMFVADGPDEFADYDSYELDAV